MASSEPTEANYPIFRECVSSIIVADSSQPKPSKAPKRRTHKSKQSNPKSPSAAETSPSSPSSNTDRGDPEELAEFIDFIATELFTILPNSLQTLTYTPTTTNTSSSSSLSQNPYTLPLSPSTLESLSTPIPPSIPDTLSAYALLPPPTNTNDPATDLLSRILTEYIPAVTRPPPVWAKTRTSACEICERDWIPLSYHHLIPRSVHAKVLKKGWHEEWMLNSVAWLCRACHSFVHRMAGNEELAREWFTVERIMEREDVRDWARWVGRVRWKAR